MSGHKSSGGGFSVPSGKNAAAAPLHAFFHKIHLRPGPDDDVNRYPYQLPRLAVPGCKHPSTKAEAGTKVSLHQSTFS